MLSPGVLREYVTGGDLIANTVYVAATTVAVYALATRRWAGAIAAAALGVTLASRGNFAFVLIPLAFVLAVRAPDEPGFSSRSRSWWRRARRGRGRPACRAHLDPHR